MGQTANTGYRSEGTELVRKRGRAGEQIWRTHGQNETREDETKALIGSEKTSLLLLGYVICQSNWPVHVAFHDIVALIVYNSDGDMRRRNLHVFIHLNHHQLISVTGAPPGKEEEEAIIKITCWGDYLA